LSEVETHLTNAIDKPLTIFKPNKMIQFDKGPDAAFAKHFAALPDHDDIKENFWYDWGPVFYRGRLDGSAKILCVASDPGPTERIAGRTLVGNAGQRVQGFLHKTGLTQSYVCLNGWAYALFPSHLDDGIKLLRLQLIHEVFGGGAGPSRSPRARRFNFYVRARADFPEMETAGCCRN
jgi:hypothetical protein